MAEIGLHGKARIPRYRGRYTTGRDHDPSNEVANNVLQFSVAIPRAQLRPQYGNGFAGAPLHSKPTGQLPSERETGGCRDTSETKDTSHAGGTNLV